MPIEAKSTPVILVIFGADGDLTWRKLVPALYNLSIDGFLPQKFAMIGVDGREGDLDAWRMRLRSGVDQFSQRGKADTGLWEAFATHLLAYQSGNFSDGATFIESVTGPFILFRLLHHFYPDRIEMKIAG